MSFRGYLAHIAHGYLKYGYLLMTGGECPKFVCSSCRIVGRDSVMISMHTYSHIVICICIVVFRSFDILIVMCGMSSPDQYCDNSMHHLCPIELQVIATRIFNNPRRTAGYLW